MLSDGGRVSAEMGKSVCVSVIFTLAAVLIFALFIKLFSIGSSVITPVNQIIKMLAIFIGCILCLKPGKTALKGARIGYSHTFIYLCQRFHIIRPCISN